MDSNNNNASTKETTTITTDPLKQQQQSLLDTAKDLISKTTATVISGTKTAVTFISETKVAIPFISGTASVTSAIPFINFIGFTTSGVASKSIAASLMSKYVLFKGTGVASGSIISILQSIGATAALGPLGVTALFVIGGTAGGVGYYAYDKVNNYYFKKSDKGNEN
ncbi:hypothetical protein ABK040_000904 [Willaertia magna]